MLLQDLDYALLDFPEVRAKFVTLAQQNLRVCAIASLGSYGDFVMYCIYRRGIDIACHSILSLTH